MSPDLKPHDAARAPETGVQNLALSDSVSEMADRETRSRGLPFRGDLMREARKARGWKQRDAAEAIGVGLRGYQVWERAGRDARAEPGNIDKIAQVFEVPREELLAGDEPVAVLSEVERLRLVEVQLGDLAEEVRRARKQLTDQDAALNERLAALGSAIERLSADVAGQASRTRSKPGSSSTRANG
jgi:transcriptional regulator with XRE-family HTH domain